MYVYLVNYILIAIYGISIKDKKKLTAIIGIQMFIILAFRDLSVGKVDLNIYASGYDYIGKMSLTDVIGSLHIIKNADLIWPYSFESGYVFLNWMFSNIGLNFQSFLVIYDAFVVISWCHLIHSYSKDIAFSFLILISFGIYTYSFYILRQSLAVCILIWAYDKILTNEKRKFWCLWIIAFFIHRASIVFIIMYLHRNVLISKAKFTKSLMGIMAFFVGAPIIYNHIIIHLLSSIGKGKYTTTNFSYNNQIILMIGIAILIYLFVDFDNEEVNKEHLILYSLPFSIALEILGMCNDGFARIIEFIYIYTVLLIPNMISINCKDKNIVLYKVVISFSFLVFYIYSLNESYIIPYKCIFE